MQRIFNIGVRITYVAGVAAWVISQTSGTAVAGAVIWRDVIAAAVMIIPWLLGIGYRDFSRRVSENASKLDTVHDKLEKVEEKLAEVSTRLEYIDPHGRYRGEKGERGEREES